MAKLSNLVVFIPKDHAGWRAFPRAVRKILRRCLGIVVASHFRGTLAY